MANKKIKLDPAQWIIDDNGLINFRYRVVTDDLNIKSAMSSVYSVQAPAISEIFESIIKNISTETVGETTVIRVTWTTKPQYTDMKYFVFVQTPADDGLIYNKTITENNFSYLVDNNAPDVEGTYKIAIALPSTTKTVTNFTKLFELTATL